MKLFSFRMRAISVFTRDTGMSTRRCRDAHALRIRVSISAIGSVMLMKSNSSRIRRRGGDQWVIGGWWLVATNHQSPATNHYYQEAFRTPGIIPDKASSRKQMRQTPNRRRNARDRPQRLQRLCACTANFGLRFVFSIQDFFAIDEYRRKCGKVRWSAVRFASDEPPALLVVAAERHAQLLQQRERHVVAVRARHEGDVHAVDLLDVVVVDLGEDHLLLDAERVIATSIEGARTEAAEVANTRDRHRDEPVEELPHARAAQRHRRPDLLPLTQAEVRDRLLRLLAHGLLAGDRRQLFDDLVQDLGLLDGFTDADVEHDLLERRDLVGIREVELLHQLWTNLPLVDVAQPGRRRRDVRARVRSASLRFPAFLTASL